MKVHILTMEATLNEESHEDRGYSNKRGNMERDDDHGSLREGIGIDDGSDRGDDSSDDSGVGSDLYKINEEWQATTTIVNL